FRIGTAVTDEQADDRSAVPFWGHERGWRCLAKQDDRSELARRRRHDLTIDLEYDIRAIGAPGDESARDRRCDLMESITEARDDAEVAAAAAHCPEQVGVVNAVRRAQHAVRGDDVGLLEIVDGPAEPARQVTE